MTEAEAVEAITQAFITGWATLHPAGPTFVPLVPEGEPFDALDTWVRFVIVPSDRQLRTMGPKGTRKVKDIGSIGVQVFTPVGQGVAARARLCDDVREVLEFEDIAVAGEEPVKTREGPTRNPTTEGRWITATVVLSYEYWTTG